MALINAKSGIAIAICLSLALLLSGCALTFDPRDTAAKSLFPAGNGSGTLPDSNSLPSSIVLSLQEIAKHSSASDCWVAINGKVLDLSDFTSHPGGSAYIPYCGTDGTAAYDRQGHSSAADALMASYIIGSLGQTVQISQPSPTASPPSSNPSPPPRRGGDDDDGDDD